jgi:hypothetical protein
VRSLDEIKRMNDAAAEKELKEKKKLTERDITVGKEMVAEYKDHLKNLPIEKKAEYLFDLLDNIDTVGDMVKADDKAYREAVEAIHKMRFRVATTDGHEIFWDCRESHPILPLVPENPNN